MNLTISNITKKFGSKIAVDDFNYDFHNGIYGLLGPNGSGKSTLMRMICDILRPNSGQITLDGEKIVKLDDTYRDILGYLPQDFGYYPQFSANDFLMYFAILKGLDKNKAKDRVVEVLEMVSLIEERNHKIKSFSGGMKQRLGIAQALLNNPKILIVDEPTAGLDPKERMKFKNILARCAHDKIVLLSTHIVTDVENIATEILIMKNGKLHMAGMREDLIKSIENNVFSVKCNEEEVEEFNRKYLVTGMTPIHNQVYVRFISKIQPNAETKQEVANLEDLYLKIFRDKNYATL